jgi:hypothetical protein
MADSSRGPTAAEWIVAIRLTDDNKAVRDYVLIPTKVVVGRYAGYMRFTDKACDRLGFERFETADALARFITRSEETQHQKGGRATRRTVNSVSVRLSKPGTGP